MSNGRCDRGFVTAVPKSGARCYNVGFVWKELLDLDGGSMLFFEAWLLQQSLNVVTEYGTVDR